MMHKLDDTAKSGAECGNCYVFIETVLPFGCDNESRLDGKQGWDVIEAGLEAGTAIIKM